MLYYSFCQRTIHSYSFCSVVYLAGSDEEIERDRDSDRESEGEKERDETSSPSHSYGGVPVP